MSYGGNLELVQNDISGKWQIQKLNQGTGTQRCPTTAAPHSSTEARQALLSTPGGLCEAVQELSG